MQARYSAARALAHPWIAQDGAAPDAPLDVLVVQNIRKFSGYNRVKQAILVEIAKTFEADEIVDLRRQFALLDKDGSGTISIEEMVNALSDLRTGESAKNVFSAQDIQEVSGNHTGPLCVWAAIAVYVLPVVNSLYMYPDDEDT